MKKRDSKIRDVNQQKEHTPRERMEKLAEKWEETRLYAYFVRLFEKYDIRNEANLSNSVNG